MSIGVLWRALGSNVGSSVPARTGSSTWTLHAAEGLASGIEVVNLVHLLLTVGLEELINEHPATSDSDDKLVIHDLGVDLS